MFISAFEGPHGRLRRATIDQMFRAIQRLRNLPQTGQVIDAAVHVLGETEETRHAMDVASCPEAPSVASSAIFVQPPGHVVAPPPLDPSRNIPSSRLPAAIFAGALRLK